MMIMNKEQQDMQFLGLFGIYKESYKIILSWRKIFTKITLSLILPLSFMFLIQIQVSNSLFTKIINHSQQIISTPQDTPQFKRLSQTVSSEWVTFLVFKVFYLALSIIFSLLTTSAISYTISLFYASTYDDEVVNLRKAISIVPKICARLMTTFLCVFMALLVYNFVAVLVFIILALTINAYAGTENYAVLGVASVFSIILVLTYVVGLFYLSLIWLLSNSVTVLEDSYGFEAMKKSKELIKGKMGLSLLLVFTIIVSYGLIHFLFMMVVVQGWNMNSVVRIAYSILCLLLLSHQILLGQVTQTVLYFVCKCYHKQNIDKSDLSIYLEYQPLKNKDVC
ncbi:uncharacterized protein LOC130943353 [Arachis stenosperma]|uniref:uncharacterized protein LOC130943353 n=1 Tax=Arachis stenosperma TaxID=217475 RepID=UPI0025ACD162|nr:uncharacterized protein LOC130943353 [Arachis stenosperma]